MKEGKVPSCGGAIIRPHSDSKYFELETSAEAESWEWTWFYASDIPGDHREAGMPKFTDVPYWQKPEWS